MRVVVTGASGFIGRHTLLSLPGSWEVFALYRPGNQQFVPFLKAHQLKHVRPVACDLTNAEQIKQVAGYIGREIDSCLYLASNTSILRSIENPAEDLTINAIGLLNTLQHWRFHHLVYLSSGTVYLGLSGLVSPEMALAPAMPYAISKLAAENYIRACARYHHSPVHATIIRFFGAFGPYEPPQKLYTKLVRRFAFEQNPHFTVTGDGTDFIDVMYIDDAVRAVMQVLSVTPSGVQIIDLGMGNAQSVDQIVSLAAHVFGLEAQIAHEGVAPSSIACKIDPGPFRSRYGVTPQISREEGLRRLCSYLRQEEIVGKA